MILTYEEGEIFRSQMINEYEVELELMCINSSFISLEKVKIELNKALELIVKYPGRVLLRESEMHSKEEPYYELSVFCFKKEQKDIENQLKIMDFILDIAHDLDE